MTKKEIKKLDRYYLAKYNITWADRQRMFKEQKGCCALCGKHERELKRRLHVDHNHTTGKIRSLACYFCNHRRIGQLTLEWAKRVYEYLVKYDGT